MYLSIFSNVIEGDSPDEVAAKTAEYGFESVQFTPAGAHIGFGFDRTNPDASFDRWADAYARVGLHADIIAAYINLLHPDLEVRRRNIDTFKQYLEDMGAFGCRYISTETGSLSAVSDWDYDPANRTADALAQLREVTDEILPVAEANDVTILYEPYVVHVCDSPQAGADFVRSYASEHLAMLMDPTNWFTTAMLDPATVTQTVDATLRSGFEAEAGLFKMAHAKDVCLGEQGLDAPKPALPGPGQGVLNYPLYLELLAEHGYDGPLIIEHLTEAEVPEAVEFMREQLATLEPGV